MTDIKIFVTYKEKHKVLKSDIITPIQTGRAIADEVFEDMIGDDTGDNISIRNPKYSELSAQYWVWKNYDKIGNPDYVGFMHYRRHFIFNDKPYYTTSLGTVEFDALTDEYIKQLNLYNSKEIKKQTKGYDIIIGNKIDCRQFNFLPSPTPREAFRWNEDLNVADYDKMNSIIKEKYPEYENTIEQIENGYTQYWYNMFIMKKKYFFEYSNFWYSIISELEKQIDTDMYGENATRILGYLSERILGIFVMHKMFLNKLKIKELRLSYLKNVNNYDEVLPVFKQDFIPVVMISSDYFVPYLYTALESIKENSSEDFNYDITILTRDMSQTNRDIITKNFSCKNISVRFLDVFYNKKFHTGGHVPLETYFRILIPKLLKKYKKVLYLDCDTVVNKDLKYLDAINIDNFEIAAVKDYTLQSFVNNSKRDEKSYIKDKLKIEDPYSLFNGGVLLYNISLISDDFESKITNLLEHNDYRYFDQDPFNIYFNGKVLYLDAKWNFTPLSFFKCSIKCLPKVSKDILLEAQKDVGIIHFNSNIKPWFAPCSLMAEIWWGYARKTPFYEEIMARLIDFKVSQRPPAGTDYHTVYMMEHPFRNFVKKISYKIKKQIGSKAHRSKYKEKYNRLKSKLKQVKNLKDQVKRI